MIIRRLGKKVIAGLKSNEEIISCLAEICRNNKISYAKVTAIGTFSEILTDNIKVAGSLKSKKISLLPGIEILFGYIVTRPDGKHINLFTYIRNKNENCISRVIKGEISGTCEIVIDIIEGIISEDTLRQRYVE